MQLNKGHLCLVIPVQYDLQMFSMGHTHRRTFPFDLPSPYFYEIRPIFPSTRQKLLFKLASNPCFPCPWHFFSSAKPPTQPRGTAVAAAGRARGVDGLLRSALGAAQQASGGEVPGAGRGFPDISWVKGFCRLGAHVRPHVTQCTIYIYIHTHKSGRSAKTGGFAFDLPKELQPAGASKHRCPVWLLCQKNRWPWFTCWFNHLPGKSIYFPKKKTPMVMKM